MGIDTPEALLLVVSGPSGSGKTTNTTRWCDEDGLLYSRSVTTRNPRPGGDDERRMTFVSRERFVDMVRNGELIEWITPQFGSCYGTPAAPIREAIANGLDMVFDVSPPGLLNLRRHFPGRVVGIFLAPPDFPTLEARLAARHTEGTAERATRLRMARQDFNFVDVHDYHVVNDRIDDTMATLRAIRRAEQFRTSRQRIAQRYESLAASACVTYYGSDPGEA